MGKLKKAQRYAAFRAHELAVSVKEYQRGSKLNKKALRTFNDSSMLVSAHSVEKGLGLRNAGPGHSGPVVNKLLDRLTADARSGEGIHAFPFRETLRIVTAYMDFQEKFDTGLFEMYGLLKDKYERLLGILGEAYMKELRSDLEAGAEEIPEEEITSGRKADLESFLRSRHSIRSFEKKTLPDELIRKAVEMANLAPSACNRQPSYVYFCSDQEKVAVIDRLITGSSGFKGEVPNYMVVTTDRACFSYVEQYQWYINGGIYLAYLSLALHSLGIGHCIMQWKAFYETEEELKKMLGISGTEAIIAVIGCGYVSGKIPCLKAQRKKAEDTLRIID